MLATGVSAVGTRYNFPSFRRLVALGHAVILVLEFWKLADAYEALRPDHEWRRHFGVTVLANVQIQQKLDQRPLQPRAPVRVEQKTAAGKLGAARKIHELQRLAKFDVRFRFEGEGRLLTLHAHHGIVLRRLSDFYRFVRQVWQAQHQLVARNPDGFRLLVQAQRCGCPVRAFRLFWLRPRRFFSGPSARRFPLTPRLRWALSVSTSASRLAPLLIGLENSSMSFSSPAPRVARRWRTKSGWSRINLMSSTGGL